MNEPSFPRKINEFLELIWQKYATKNTFELISLIKDSQVYQKHHVKDEITLLTLDEMTQYFGMPVESKTTQKIRISQNGPVVVSKWQPRKISEDKKS